MDDKEKEIINKLKRRISGLEKTLQIVTGYSGRTEKNLRQLFEVISGTMPVPMVITSKTGGLIFSNEKAQEIFGFSEKNFHKTDPSDLYEDSRDCDRFLKMNEAQGEVKGFAVTLKKADGSSFPASLFSRHILFEGQNCLLTVIYDLSEFRKEEEKRLALERQLRQTHKMEALGTMAGGIAHDFNNVLTVIFGRLELAMMMLSEESKAKHHINDALTAAERARAMIMQILAFCRKNEEENSPFPISTIIAEAAKMIRSLAPSNIETSLRINSKSSIVLGDPTQIHQVLMNLCSNSIYALQNREGLIEIILEQVSFGPREKITIPGLSPGTYVRLTVSDNGPGMDKGIIERAFDPFFTTKPAGEGTGMGLSVVHGIIQSHGGAVSVESQPGKKTAFHCYIPVIAETEGMTEPAIVQKTIQRGSETILFVDDESDIVDICSQMLESLGYHVITRNNGPDALSLFKENPNLFDLVITDKSMPVMSGITMASEMLKIRLDIPVILITGDRMEDNPLSEIGIRDMLRKPFSRNDIGAAIQKALHKKQEKEYDKS
ncbi:hybrid sensor histidine kinase/response regulator [Desulfonema magnum]|uniref:histidine kinase n=1 Tax=Desulfonema magnum TaxID=45655 RepID=A0A975BSR9_9BACT|nr:ATP-binding protein [Desulfonema magnum]QTA91144.1 Two component system response regulator/histidine kinase, PAS domain-containing [Desulfonema magnum]